MLLGCLMCYPQKPWLPHVCTYPRKPWLPTTNFSNKCFFHEGCNICISVLLWYTLHFPQKLISCCHQMFVICISYMCIEDILYVYYMNRNFLETQLMFCLFPCDLQVDILSMHIRNTNDKHLMAITIWFLRKMFLFFHFFLCLL